MILKETQGRQFDVAGFEGERTVSLFVEQNAVQHAQQIRLHHAVRRGE